MPLNVNNNNVLLLIMILLMYMIYDYIQSPIVSLIRNPWTASPSLTYRKAIMNPIRFKSLTNFNVSLFYEKLIVKLTPWMDQPKKFYYFRNYDEANNTVDPRTCRGCALDVPTRILRWCIIMKGIKNWSLMYEMFDQTRQTAWNDFIHICIANLHANASEYLCRLTPGTQNVMALN